MIRPSIPNIATPPSDDSMISSSGICVSLPTSRGRSTLSMLPMPPAQNTASTMPATGCPVASSQIAAGTHTSPMPMPGISDDTTIRAPQNTALGMPATANAMPPRMPWIRPITATPLSVARVTERNLSSSRRSSSSSSGR